jgi:hypothetical protein
MNESSRVLSDPYPAVVPYSTWPVAGALTVQVIDAVVSVMFDTPMFVIARPVVGVCAGVAVGVGTGAAVWLAVGAGVVVGVGVVVGLGLGVAATGVGVGAGVAVGRGVGVAATGVGVGADVGSAAVTSNSALAPPEPETPVVTTSLTAAMCAPGAVFGTMKVARKAPRPLVDTAAEPVSSPSHVSCSWVFCVNPCPVATTLVPEGPCVGDRARVGPAAVVLVNGIT